MNYPIEYIRTSMALDTGTLEALRKLAQIWGVSKAEVMRRAVKSAEMQENEKQLKPNPTPLEALGWLQSGGGLTHEEGATLREGIAGERLAKLYWWEE